MQTRQLRVLNLVLALCAIGLGWRLAAPSTRAVTARSGRLPQGRNAASLLLVPAAQRPSEAAAQEIVAKDLFTPDRGTAQTPVAPVQAPPLPVVFGTLRLGDSYEALMAEAGQGGARRFRRVKSGEQFAGYTVAEIRDESVVVEFGGQKTTVNVYESAAAARNASAAVAQAAVRTAPAPPTAPSVVETAGEPVKATQSNTFPAGSSAASASGKPAEQSALPSDVTVTTEGNKKRFERTTPFGPQVWYEEIPQ